MTEDGMMKAGFAGVGLVAVVGLVATAGIGYAIYRMMRRPGLGEFAGPYSIPDKCKEASWTRCLPKKPKPKKPKWKKPQLSGVVGDRPYPKNDRTIALLFCLDAMSSGGMKKDLKAHKYVDRCLRKSGHDKLSAEEIRAFGFYD